MSSLGDRIKCARESRGYYQSELAQLVGVKSSGVISNWEKGLNKPDADKIVRLCEALGVSASYLLDYYGNPISGLAPSESSFMASYRSLSPAARSHVDAVLQWELEHAEAIKKALAEGSAPEDDEMSIDERVADYRRRLELEKKAGEESSVSTPAGSASTAAG